jgi:putative transposase
MELAYGADSTHKQGGPFKIENNTNLIERFHGSLKDRTKVMRALRNKKTLQTFSDGWLVHYNFFRPHMGIKEKTPAQEAKINFPFRNWKDIVEQPYQKTARIPIKTTTPKIPKLSKTMPPITPKFRKLK